MDFEGINHINESVLSKYKKIDINNSNINKYKSSCKGLSHVRTGSDYKGVIYLDEENVVGFYNIRLSDNYLQGIEINKEYQSNGLGKALLNESIKNGVINLSVNKNNNKAINMYKKDFKIIDEDNNMYYMRLKSYKEVSESTNIDKLLVWFEKPIDKLLNRNIRLYHGSSIDIKGKVIDPISINVGATKLSNPRWSTYFWDNKEMAIQWAITWEVRDKINTNCLYRNHDGKTLLVNNTNLSDEKFIDKILSKKPSFYIYETEVPISKLEMGSTAAMPEYTVSETIKIIKKTKINVTRQMIYDYFEIISKDEGDKVIDPNDMDYMSRYRNKFLDLILSNYRDSYRYLIKRDMKKREIKVGDDISNYRNKINKALDDDLLGLRPRKESNEEVNNFKKKINYETLQYQEKQYSTFDTINDLPYFLPNKLEEFANYYTNLKEDIEWQESYNDLSVNLIDRNEFININKERINKLNELYYKYPNFDNETKQRILNLGWNPEIPFSVRNRKLATESTRKKLNNYIPIKIEEFVETEEDNIINEAVENKKVPVYMICTWTDTAFGKAIRFHTKAIYTHACLAFDSKLDRMFSFNPANGINKLGGLSIEDINKYNQDGSMVVYVTYLSQEQIHKLKSNIDDLMNNVKGTTYSFLNILAMLVNKPIELSHSMVCSQFVDRMLKSVNLDLTNKPSSLVNPKDLYDSKSTKIFKAYEGPIAEFNPKKLKKNADIILRKNKKSINESVYEIPKCLLKNGINYSKLNL